MFQYSGTVSEDGTIRGTYGKGKGATWRGASSSFEMEMEKGW